MPCCAVPSWRTGGGPWPGSPTRCSTTSASTSDTAAALLDVPIGKWREVWERWRPNNPLGDDPVPFALERALKNVDLSPLRDALAAVPIHRNASFRNRVRAARRQLNQALNATWTESLGALDVHLPLLILDEAHHVKNPNQLARLFANEEAEQDAEALQGPLGNMFDKMLFLTATPFQLGHHELLRVLDRFHGVRWPSAPRAHSASTSRPTTFGSRSTGPRRQPSGSSGPGRASTPSTPRSLRP